MEELKKATKDLEDAIEDIKKEEKKEDDDTTGSKE